MWFEVGAGDACLDFSPQGLVSAASFFLASSRSDLWQFGSSSEWHLELDMSGGVGRIRLGFVLIVVGVVEYVRT